MSSFCSHENSSELDPNIVDWSDYSNYHFAEYHLKSSLQSFKCPIEIDQIHNVINQSYLLNFDKISQNKQWTYGWYIINENEYPSIINELKSEGFTNPKREKVFIVGSINQQDIGQMGNFYYILLCKLIIGNSFSIKKDPNNKQRKIKIQNIPKYYSSYKLLTPNNMSISLLSKDYAQNASQNISYQYEIFDENYICPLYVIKFKQLVDNRSKDDDIYICQKCNQKEAEVFCLVCESYFDKECFNAKHKAKGKSELNHGPYQELKHKQKQGYCYEHRNNSADYYCVTCKKPICSRCKLLLNNNDEQSINQNFHNDHIVKDIYKVYDNTSPNFFLSDEIRKRAVNQLKKIKETVKSLIEKQVSIEKEIDYEFREENDTIQSLTKEAKLKHFSVFAELSEMKSHMISMNKYFNERQNAMNEANLKAEALWVRDNYDDIINDIYNNFNEIKLDYKINPQSFMDIKQADLKIVKKLGVEKKISVNEKKEDKFFDELFINDEQHILTKNIVSLKEEKSDKQRQKEKEEKEEMKQDFIYAKDPNKYALSEAMVLRLKEKNK